MSIKVNTLNGPVTLKTVADGPDQVPIQEVRSATGFEVALDAAALAALAALAPLVGRPAGSNYARDTLDTSIAQTVNRDAGKSVIAVQVENNAIVLRCDDVATDTLGQLVFAGETVRIAASSVSVLEKDGDATIRTWSE